MDNQNHTNRNHPIDDILGASPVTPEIGTDPSADASSNLIHPDDLELERILRENREANSAPQEAFAAEPELELTGFDAPQESPAPAPVRRRTPPQKASAPKKDQKKKKRKDPFGIVQFAITLVVLALILLVGVSAGKSLYAAFADVFALGKEDITATITIGTKDDIADVAKKLDEADLIRYPKLFKLFAQLTNKEDRISAGTYELNAQLDYNAMINAMVSYGPQKEVVEIMIPEGYTCQQIFEILEENGVCTKDQLESYAAIGELSDYWFLEGVTRGEANCLEGYLFPDTYKFYVNDEPRRVLEKFLDAFDARFTDKMKTEFENMKSRYASMLASHGYSQDYINSNPLTIRKVIIISSLIEKETAGVNESYDIASVIYNRLTNQSSYPYLNIDAALVYALDGKSDLTSEDFNYDSPYNTYKYQGLVPGPICNPGRDSIYAALDPNDTSYYYYVLDPSSGMHHFSKTYNEHVNFINSIG